MNKWKDIFLRKDFLALAAAIGFFFLITMLFLMGIRGYVYRHLHADIDRELLGIVRNIQFVLPEDYHMRARSPDGIGKAEYQEIEKKLNLLAKNAGVRYVWTDILLDGNVFLTSCNRIPDSEKSGPEISYFMPYTQGVSLEEMRAFSSQDPVYATFTDAWGNFRAIFLPVRNSDGTVYLACASYATDVVDRMLRKSDLIVVLGLGCFFVAIFPFCLLHVLQSRRDRKILEKKNRELAQNREWLHITLHSIGEGVFVLDSDGQICDMNSVAEELCGWTFLEAAGKPYDEILQFDVTAESHRSVTDQVHGALASRQIICLDTNIGLLRRDGRVIDVISTIAPIPEKPPEISGGAVLIIRDVSERIKMETERLQSQKLQSLGQLTGGIAHDVNNMLAGISGATELLELVLSDDPKTMKYIALIKSATERTSSLVGKLLAFSRKGKVVSRQVDLHGIIDETCALLERSIDKRIQIISDLHADRCVVEGDPAQLQNGFLNLFLNARDAMPDGGLLHIITTNVSFDQEYCRVDTDLQPSEYVQVSIQDTGHGIPEEIQNKIFEPFTSTKDVGKGTGLGLASVYGMMKEHRGTIKFYTESGKGTIFHLYFPVTENTALAVPKEIVCVAGKRQGSVLLVEDEEILRQTGSLLLQQMGYSVIAVTNGAEAVAAYRERQAEIDCVILDVIMPVMNGYDAFLHIRQLNPEARVVISSGFTRDVSIDQMIEKGAAGYLMKPFNRLQLQKIMETVLQ